MKFSTYVFTTFALLVGIALLNGHTPRVTWAALAQAEQVSK
jgi:hypothetical protein